MDANGVNMTRLEQLYSTITLEGLHDFQDMQAVQESWLDAAYFNAEDAAKRKGFGR